MAQYDCVGQAEYAKHQFTTYCCCVLCEAETDTIPSTGVLHWSPARRGHCTDTCHLILRHPASSKSLAPPNSHCSAYADSSFELPNLLCSSIRCCSGPASGSPAASQHRSRRRHSAGDSWTFFPKPQSRSHASPWCKHLRLYPT